MKNDFYVYAYFRPWNGQPCYIGKGHDDRWLYHAQIGVKHPNKHFARIFAKAGGVLPRIKLREGLAEEEALAVEVALIAAIGRANKKGGPLVNKTDGGEGTSGMEHSPEAKAKISRGTKGRVVSADARAAIGAAHRGKIVREETRKKIGQVHAGKTLTDEHRAKISRGLLQAERQFVFSQEHRAKISRAHKGKHLSIEHRAKIAAGGVGRKHKEQSRRAISDSQRGVPCPQRGRKGRVFTEEHKDAIREALARKKASNG